MGRFAMNKVILPSREAFSPKALIDVLDDADPPAANSLLFFNSPNPPDRHAPIRLFGVPHFLNPTIPQRGASRSEQGKAPDIAILTEANASKLLAHRLGAGAAAIIPVIDATRRGRRTQDNRRADITIDSTGAQAIDEAIQLLRPAVHRLRSLPHEILNCPDPRMTLLARLFVRDRALVPRCDIRARTTFAYDDQAAVPGAVVFAEQLVALGLLERTFFDKVTICPHCSSARMTVREYCSGCGSANVVEQPVIHHMKCAYQGPERDFRRGDDLVCPKCLQQLKNFNVDYDRPGSICVCLSCGHLSAEPNVGFICLDCLSRVGARDVDSKTIYAYELTEAGRACVASGSPLPEPLADSVGAKIREFAQRHFAQHQPSCILFARLRRPPGMPDRSDAWRQICTLFGRMMRECFTPETEIIESPPNFLALLTGDRKEEVEAQLPEIRERLERYLALAPTLDLAVFASHEIPGLSGPTS